MFKKRTLFMAIFTMILSLVILPQGTVFAQFADGSYELNYEMKEKSSNNTSIADGYFSKPAKVTINGNNATIQVTVTGADMIKKLSGPNGAVKVLGESGDSRTVEFTVSKDALKNPIAMKMHIIVPDLYDMEHTARMALDTSNIPVATSTDQTPKEDQGVNKTDETAETPAAEENPPTGDNSQIMLYALLLVGSVGALLAVRKFSAVNN